MKRVLYIHGANSTKRSFAYLSKALPKHKAHFFEYNTHTPAMDNVKLAQKACDEFEPDAVIGHSLGGVMTAWLETKAKRVAISAPFGGSGIANWLPLYSQLMRDVATTSPLIMGLRNVEVKPNKFLCIVANGLDGAGFDGVLSSTTQMKLQGAKYRNYNLNHFEVLVDDDVVSVIEEWLCLGVTS